MTKEELRRAARALLRAMPPEERDACSARIARHVWEVPRVAGAGTLLLFAGRPDEVETDLIAAEAARRGIRVAYPRIHDDAGAMTLHHVAEPSALLAGRHRIREPDEALAPRIPPAEVDAVLVPGLAWDRSGGRLGRGAGYFDRLFADPAWRGFRCGLFFARQEVPAVPREPWDAALDAVVTELEVWVGAGDREAGPGDAARLS